MYPVPRGVLASERRVTVVEGTWYKYDRHGQILPLVEGGTQDKRMSKGHLPKVVYHQLCNVY